MARVITDVERLRARLVELTHDASFQLIVADKRGLITHVDPPLAGALGWRDAELIGRPLTAIIPHRLHDAHLSGFSRFLATGEPTILERPLELWISTRSGGQRRATHVITVLRVEDQWLFGAAIKLEAAPDGG